MQKILKFFSELHPFTKEADNSFFRVADKCGSSSEWMIILVTSEGKIILITSGEKIILVTFKGKIILITSEGKINMVTSQRKISLKQLLKGIHFLMGGRF